MISAHYGRKITQDRLTEICHITRLGVSMLGISRAAEKIGFRTLGIRLSLQELIEKRPFPCILHWNQQHYVVLYDVSRSLLQKGKLVFHIADPGFGHVKLIEAEFKKAWLSTVTDGKEMGLALLLEPTNVFYEQNSEIPKRKGLGLLLSYFSRYKKYFLQMGLGLLLGSFIQLVFPFLTQAIVDTGIGNRNISFIYLVLLAQAMLIISRTAVEYIKRWLMLHISVRINLSLKSDFLVKLLKLPMIYFDTRGLGDILQRIADHERVESFITTRSLQTVFSFTTLVIFGVVLFIYNLSIFFVFLLGGLLYGGWVMLFLKKRKILDYKFFSCRAQNQTTGIQLITGMQEIKLQGCTNRKRWEWEDIQVDLLELQTEALKLDQKREAGNILINEGKNLIITILAATAVINGEMSLGMMLATQYIIGQLDYPIEQAVHFSLGLQDVKISLDRINEIHGKDDEASDNQINIPDFSGGSIQFKNLFFRYDGSTSPLVINNINLVIPKGKVTAIVGYSGSGKTTMLKLLLGYYPPSEGEILVDGINLQSINPNWWREQCGVVMQDGFIFSESVARNIANSDGEIDKQRLVYAAKISNILDTVQQLPLKFNTKVGQEGKGLSQGQKQRLLIARAVYRNPFFLIFDEATNALDAMNERVIVENLQEFYEGRTVIVVAHRLSTVRNADQIVVLSENGSIAEVGRHDELIKNESVYFNLIKNQLELGN